MSLVLSLPVSSFPRTAVSPGEAKRLKAILEHTVATVFEVHAAALNSPTRGPATIAFARQVAMYLAHVVLGLSRNKVGRIFVRDRTTVTHACEKVEDRRDDPAFDRVLDLLERVVLTLVLPRELD